MDSGGQSPTLANNGPHWVQRGRDLLLAVRSKHQITTYENLDGSALKGGSQYKAMQFGGIGHLLASVLKRSSGQPVGVWVVMKGAGRILNGNFGQSS